MDPDDFDDGDDDAMVDDYYFVNNADRADDGRFMTWVKRRFYTDGRREPDPSWQERFVNEIQGIVGHMDGRPVAESISSIADLRRATDRLELELVAVARAAGWSWRAVATALEVDVAAAHRRFAVVDVDYRHRPRTA